MTDPRVQQLAEDLQAAGMMTVEAAVVAIEAAMRRPAVADVPAPTMNRADRRRAARKAKR